MWFPSVLTWRHTLHASTTRPACSSRGVCRDRVKKAALPHGSSFDVDFHSVPANSAEEPLEKHYVSSRSRSQKGILVFLVRDAEQRVMRYANAGVIKDEQADEILQFVKFWKKHTGKL